MQRAPYRKYPSLLRYQFINNALTKDECRQIPIGTRVYWRKKHFEDISASKAKSESVELLNAFAEIQQYRKRIRELVYLLTIYRKLVSVFEIKYEDLKSLTPYIKVYVNLVQKNSSNCKRMWKRMPVTNRQWNSW